MLIPFDSLTDTARIWIYPSSRKFYTQEIPELDKALNLFLEDWLSDEIPVAFSIQYQRFLILGAEATTTIPTADIDRLVSFVLDLQSTFSVDLLDRMNVCFKQGEFVQYKEVKEFKKLIKQKSVSHRTIVFDNLIELKGEFNEHWEVPITESWYNRFLK